MDKDRNLLFGVVAVQLRRVTPAQLVEIAGAWAMDPSKDLSQRLTEAGILSESERKRLGDYVDDIVKAHGEDSQAALASIHQARTIQNSIEGMYNSLQGTSPPDMTKPSLMQWLDIDSTRSLPAVEEAPGRYTHPSEYARGGVGRVLLVHDQHLGRDIALKELLPSVESGGSTLKAGDQTPVQLSLSLMTRFLQEARITGQLEHPSIIPVYELGRRKDGTIYYTMKLVRGTTLTTSLKQGGNLEERLKLLPNFLDLCHAIGYAHSRGIIHRDIKPNNVMIGEFGETVVLDWGLAKIRGQDDAHADELEHTLRNLRLAANAKSLETANGQVLGTPVFMPPEQARGEIDAITERSDVYALGAVLYSILTGQFPYSGRNASEVLKKVQSQEPALVESIEPHAPPELVAICRRAMHRDAEKRYANGKEVADEINRFLSGALVGAYDYGFSEHLRRFVRRHMATLATAAACAAALLGFAVFSYFQIMHERNVAVEARNNEQTQRERAEKELYVSNVLLASDRIEERRFDLADQVLEAAPAVYRNWEWDYLKRLCHQDTWTFRGHTRIVEDISVSGDGTKLLSASDDGTARLIDASNGTESKVLADIDGMVQSAELNGAGTRALVLGTDDSLTLYDAASGAVVAKLEGHSGTVRAARFSADGKWLLSASVDGHTQRWDSETGGKVWSADGQAGLNDATIAPGGDYIAEIGAIGSLTLMDATTGATIGKAEIEPTSLNRILFGPDGQRIAVAHENWLTILDVPGLERLASVEAGKSDVMALAFDADGVRVAAGMEDGTAGIWDAATGAKLVALEGHRAPIRGIAFFGKERTVVTASRDHTLRVWNADSGEELRVLEGHSGAIRGMELRPESGEAWTASEDHTIKKWDVRANADAARTVLRGHTGEIRSLAFAKGNRALLSVSWDGTAGLWDLKERRASKVLRLDKGDVLCATWSPDGKHIATGATDNSIRLWNAETQTEEAQLREHSGPVSGVRYNPAKPQLLSVSWDDTAVLWDSERQTLIYRKEVFWGKQGLGEFSPDGARVALPTANFSVTVLDTQDGTSSVVLTGHEDRIKSFAFSADSKKLLTTSLDRTARIWDARSGTLLSTLTGDTGGVTCGVFSPDVARVATGTTDGRICFWDAASGALLHTLKGHVGTVLDIRYATDSSRVFTISQDGTAGVWDPQGPVELLQFVTGDTQGEDAAQALSERCLAASYFGNSIMVCSLESSSATP
ncbi:MAG: protein kinase [Candidatus Hydrogenedentes bacterium]|nr:protein kinase [Candidatus Hydrogenedentota bacterium]